MRPFRFGVSTSAAGSRRAWVDRARRIESLGYQVLLTSDHLADTLSPMAPLVSAADATGLRVGTFVLNNDLRHPVLLAREAATIDLLTDGRLELGLGAGHMKAEYDEVGVTFESHRVRADRLSEAVAVVKAVLRGEPVTWSGDHYAVSGHRGSPARPAVPILVGGSSRAVLALAAKEADIVGLAGVRQRRGAAPGTFTLVPPDEIAGHVSWVREQAGARADEIELNALVQAVVVTDDRRAAAERLGAEHMPGVPVDELLASPVLLLGSVDEIVEQLLERRARLGLSYYVVFDAAMDVFAPVVRRLAGT